MLFVSEATIKAREVERRIKDLERFLTSGPAESWDWDSSDWRRAAAELEQLTIAATDAFGQGAPLRLAQVLELLAETAPLARISNEEVARRAIPWMLEAARRLRDGRPPDTA